MSSAKLLARSRYSKFKVCRPTADCPGAWLRCPWCGPIFRSMNRMQWLQVWGWNPVAADRRRQMSPPRSSDGSTAFQKFMRRATDRQHLEVRPLETADVW